MNNTEEEVFLTSAEVKKILSVSSQTLLRLRRSGRLDTYYQGMGDVVPTNARPVYSAENVRAFLESRDRITKHTRNQPNATEEVQ